jgi:tetraprenyl-beta-curcumene synthase
MPGLSRQSATLARATGRELVWGLRGVSGEVTRWRALAQAIPDPGLRADALRALARKRGNIDGAALFWTVPDRRNRELLRALVAWEVLADYLDCVSERGAELGAANGRQLHLALVEALRPDAAPSELPVAHSDYYRHHHSGEDGGYLRALVDACRSSCARLPSYERAAPFMVHAAGLAGRVLPMNHEPDHARRDQALQSWAARELPGPAAQTWFERTAGASSWLTVHAMLALAAQPVRRSSHRAPGWADQEAARTYEAYLRWIAPVGAMLDSYGDIVEDETNDHHSYVGHYPSIDVAAERVGELVRRSRSEARALPDGSRHALIAACMVAFYLSKDSAWTPALSAHTRSLLHAGGPQAKLLLPVLRLWRTAYGQRSA